MHHQSPRVRFLIAGVQKGGTTALADYLRQHPTLFIPASKELHFFDNETLCWHHPQADYESYHAAFHDAPPGSQWGEATPIYSYWWPAMPRIWAYNPGMRLILQQEQLLAHPASTLSSVHQFLGVEPIAPQTPLQANSGRYSNPIDQELRARLQHHFDPEITQLEQLLGWDLSHWRS